MRILLIVLGLFVTSCAGVRVYEVPSVQKTLSEALQRSDEVTQKAQLDYNEKKLLFENLSRGSTPGFRSAETELKGELSEMQFRLTEMAEQRKRMMAANSDLASLSYGRTTIHAGDPEFDKTEDAIKTFKAASEASNLALETYSRESNQFTETIEKKRLLIHFEPVDFNKRVQTSVRKSQETSRDMQAELDRAEQLLIHSSAKGLLRQQMENLSADLQTQAQTYTEKAQRYASIAKEMRAITADGRVTSLDPQWPEVQKQMNEYERLNSELMQIQSQFTANVEKFRGVSRQAP